MKLNEQPIQIWSRNMGGKTPVYKSPRSVWCLLEAIYPTGGKRQEENNLQQYKDAKLQTLKEKYNFAPPITKEQEYRKGHE